MFPNIAIMIVLVPVSSVLLIYSMVFLGTDSITAIISYVLAFYTLTVWCITLPKLIKVFKAFKQQNKYAKIWQNDARLRVNAALYGTLIWNTSYAAFQLALGFWHHTFWYYSLAVYYILLAVMRFFLVRHSSKHRPGEKMREELVKYRSCGIILLAVNFALSVIIFFMVYWDRTFIHHEITTIAMAAYTFTSFTMAVINLVKYRKYNSPVFSASKVISLACACVSMLTLEATMLTTFDDGKMSELARKLFLSLSSGAVSILIVVMAVYMIAHSNKKLKLLKQTKEL